MKKILLLILFLAGFWPEINQNGISLNSFSSIYAQCGGASSEEQHSGGIGGSFDLDQTSNDFNCDWMAISNPASLDPDVLAGQIFGFLNAGNPNASVNPRYSVWASGGMVNIRDNQTNQIYQTSPATGSAALNYYDNSRSQLIITAYNGEPPVVSPLPCPQYQNSPIPGYTPLDPFGDPNNPFNNGGGSGGGSSGNSSSTDLDPDDFNQPLTIPEPTALNMPCPTDQNVSASTALVKAFYPNANRGRSDLIVTYINKHMATFGITTRKELAYFLGQAFVETDGFYNMTEGTQYSKKEYILNAFNLSNFAPGEDLTHYLNCECLLNKMYANDDGNGDSASGDGIRYRGRGVIQLTHKGSYNRFNTYYHTLFPNDSRSFVTHPERLADDYEVAVLSALWEFRVDKRPVSGANIKNHIGIAIDANDPSRVSKIINGGKNKLAERVKVTNAILQIFCL